MLEFKKVKEDKFNKFIKENSSDISRFDETGRVDKLDLVSYKNDSGEEVAKYYIDIETKETFGWSIKEDKLKKGKKNDTKRVKKASK